MIELRSSKHNIGTKRYSILGIINKFVFKVAISIFTIIILIAFITPRFIPIEKIIPIPKIASTIYEKTGLTIKINGKARLSIIPFLGITAQNIEITNQSFNENNLFFAKNIEIKIAVFPLIFKKIVIKNIILEQSTINIIQCDGRYNFFTPDKHIEANTKHQSNTSFFNKLPSIQNIRISNLNISDSNFFFTKCHKNGNITHKLTDFNAKISIPNSKSNIKAISSFSLNHNKFNIKIESSSLNQLFYNKTGKSTITIKSDTGEVNANAEYTVNKNIPTFFENIKIAITGEDIPPKAFFNSEHSPILSKMPPINFALHADLKQNIFNITNFKIESQHFSLNSTNIQGNINTNQTDFINIPTNGTVQFSVNEISNLLNTLELKTENPTNLPKKINGNFGFSTENGLIKIIDGIILLDSQPIKFSSNSNFNSTNKSTIINISGNKINLDQYLPHTTQNTQNATQSKKTQNNDKTITLQTPKNHEIEIFFIADELIFHNKKFTELSMTNKISENSILLKCTANAFEGTLSITSNISTQNNQLQSISSEIKTKNAEIKDILSYFTQKNILEGKTTSHISIFANGSTINQLLNNNHGTATIQSPYITVQGFDANTFVNDIKNDYKKMLSGTIKEKYFSPNKKSNIQNITSKLNISNGIITNEKTTIEIENIHIKTSGTININSKNISHTIQISNNNKILPSILVSGEFSDIKYSIDAKGYIQQNAQQLLEQEFNNTNIQKKLEKIESLFKKLKK